MISALAPCYAVSVAIMAPFVLAAIVHASRPGALLAGTVGKLWFWWLIHQPTWIPAEIGGVCAFCSAFWWLGIPTALFVGFTGAGLWALGVPFMVAVLAAKLIEK